MTVSGEVNDPKTPMERGCVVAVKSEVPGKAVMGIFLAFEGQWARILITVDDEEREIVVYRQRVVPLPPIAEA